MCRLFGMLSQREASPVKWLVEDDCSLLAQSDGDKARLQKDGWGMAHFKGKARRMVLSTGAVFEEKERFKAVSESFGGNAVVAHIRKASNPLKLPQKDLMIPENLQPFMAEGWAFIHNGTLNDPKGAEKMLGDYRDCIGGTNDSEVLFWHFIKAHDESKDAPSALRLMESRIAKCRPKGGEAYTALNLIVTNGKEMHAYCKFTAQPKKFPKSICLGKQGTYNMCYTMEKGKVIVMSEMSNRSKGWKMMENGDILSAKIVKGKIQLKLIS